MPDWRDVPAPVVNILIVFYLIFSLFFMQTNAYATSPTLNPLFNASKKVPKSITVKKYKWDESSFEMAVSEEIVTNPSGASGATKYDSAKFATDAIAYLTDPSKKDQQKIVWEYEFENHFENVSINYKDANQLTTATGSNKYKNLINSSSNDGQNRNNNIDELRSNVAKAVVITAVSNYGQKASTAAARSYLSEDGKKLIVEAKKVNYLDMFTKDIQSRCQLGLPIPKLMYSTMATMVLAMDGANPDLEKTPGVIDLEKDGSLCDKSYSDIVEVLMETSLFMPSGDIKLFFKDHNWNKLIAAAFTTDAIYFNDAIEATMVFDIPKKSDVQEHKSKSKYFKLKQWFTFQTSTDWYRIIPITFIHSDINFGSFSLADVNKQGTKIAGTWAQQPITEGSKLTPENHSINFMVVPITKHNGNVIGGETLEHNAGYLYTKSNVKKSWAIFTVLLVIVAVVAIVWTGGMAAGLIANSTALFSFAGLTGAQLTAMTVFGYAATVAIVYDMETAGTGSKSVGSVPEKNLANTASIISKLKYKNYLEDFVNSLTSNSLYENKPDAFFSGQGTENIFEAMDTNAGTADAGTLVHSMIGSIGLFGSNHRLSITKKAAEGATLYNDNFLKLKSNFTNRLGLITPVIDNIFDFDATTQDWGLSNTSGGESGTGLGNVEGASQPSNFIYGK